MSREGDVGGAEPSLASWRWSRCHDVRGVDEGDDGR
jgi:hypothetical protein